MASICVVAVAHEADPLDRTRGIDVEHVLELGQRQLGQRLQAAEQAVGLAPLGDGGDALGDVLAEIADTFEIGRDADGADDLAQVLGHRLAAGDDEDRLVVDLALGLVEQRVVADDLRAKFQIAH